MGVYGSELRRRLESPGIEEVPQSPWQNGYAERLMAGVPEPFRDPERHPPGTRQLVSY